MNISDLDGSTARSLLPHQYPMTFIDKIESFDRKQITCQKNVTINEPFFQGHFIGRPILPGCITLECVAQTAAYLYIGQTLLHVKSINEVSDSQELAKHVGYLAGVNNFKFLKLVVPGDTLHITVVENGSQPNAKLFQAKVINQNNDIVANGRILVTQK